MTRKPAEVLFITEKEGNGTIMFQKRIYLDNAATTRTRRQVLSEMKKYFSREYANPSSIHRDGLIARGSIEMARERIAKVLHCSSHEIIFTGSGTEANNLALTGAARGFTKPKNHIITTSVEHSSVLHTSQMLEKSGFRVTYLSVNHHGHINLEQLENSIGPATGLFSMICANNEIGTVQDLEKIYEILKRHSVLFHLDAVAALPFMKFRLDEGRFDLVSFSGHKIYAPKGIGVLYIKSGVEIQPVTFGGGQEFSLRSGTENIPYIVGLSRAFQLNDREKDKYNQKLIKLKKYIIENVLFKIPGSILVGDPEKRAPGSAGFCFQNINGKMLVKELSRHGVDSSSGAACSSPRNDPSHVLAACGIPADYIFGFLRITLGRYNNKRQVKRFIGILEKVVKNIRENPVEYSNESIFISQEEFRKKIEQNEEIQIIDLRFPRIPSSEIHGSIRIPPWLLKYKLKQLDREKETVVICYQGDVLSPDAYQVLKDKKFRNVKVLKGGYFSYAGFSF